METLLRLDGVADVTLRPYEVGVGIGKAYDWEDIQPHVITTLKKVFVEKCQVTEDEVKVIDKYDAPRDKKHPDPDDFNDDEDSPSVVAEDDTQ